MVLARKLCKSRHDKMIAGCLAGIAEYFGWDPTVVRIVFVIFTIFGALLAGVVIYLVLYLLMPE